RADALGRRVGRAQLRVRNFQLPELPHVAVVLRVAEGGPIEDVVFVVGAFQDGAKLRRALGRARVRRWRHESTVSSIEARTTRFRPACLAAYSASSAFLIRTSGWSTPGPGNEATPPERVIRTSLASS